MKLIAILIFTFITSLSTYCQTNLLDGDLCFDNGDYTCAESKYKEAFNLATGKDKQIAEIKLTRAKWCADHLKSANQAFSSKNYKGAIENYQSVLESNPKDTNAKAQLDKCNNLLNRPAASTLHKATPGELTDIWNNKYGIMPERRQKLIDAGIDPVDAQRRINNKEGKPTNVANQENKSNITNDHLSFSSSGGKVSSLSLSTQSISYDSNGGESIIRVYTKSETYHVIFLPDWCSVTKYNDIFSITCKSNYNNLPRESWFNVTAGDDIIRVNVTQSGDKSSGTTASRTSSKSKNHSANSRNDSFNGPTAYYPWGLSIGSVTKYLNEEDLNIYIDNTSYYYPLEITGIQVGIKYEPLFKYGFGLNTGIFYEFFSPIIDKSLGGNFANDPDFKQHVFNVPLHLEYRLNFSKNFNILAFGGAGFDGILDSYHTDIRFNTSLEYGGGLRINHVQFNFGQSYLVKHINDLLNFQNLSNDKYKHYMFSVSYML